MSCTRVLQFAIGSVLNEIEGRYVTAKLTHKKKREFFAYPRIGKIYNLFRYIKKALTCLYIKQLYSRYAYVAFRRNLHITKTYLYNFDPLEPHFYIVKLRFTGVYIILLISAQNIDCGYSLEPPRRGGSNEYPQSMFWAEIRKKTKKKKKTEILSVKFQFLVVKFSIYLNRRVFVMTFL